MNPHELAENILGIVGDLEELARNNPDGEKLNLIAIELDGFAVELAPSLMDINNN